MDSSPLTLRGESARKVSWKRRALLFDLEQLDVEGERGVGADSRRGTGVSVRERRRADEVALSADFHGLKSLAPAGDDLSDLEDSRLPAFDRTIEDGPVPKRSFEVDLDPIAGLRGSAGARLELPHDQAGRLFDGALFRFGFLEKLQ